MATDKAARQKPAREKPAREKSAREKSQHERADTETRPDLLGRIAAPLAAINRAPLTSYHVVMVVTALLTVIGLGMVLSSSNVLAFSGGGTPFDIFLRRRSSSSSAGSASSPRCASVSSWSGPRRSRCCWSRSDCSWPC